jgi:hypothetical protein
MKAIPMIGLATILAVVAAWATILRAPNRPPFAIASMAGCYFSDLGGAESKIRISSSGQFSYNGKSTRVSAYSDKIGLSLLPAAEVLATSNGKIIFLSREPLILRIGNDKSSISVPYQGEGVLVFKKVKC